MRREMKLSIIVPTLNRLESLKRCIDSLRLYAPSFEHEIIVIDGGSTDGTQEWLLDQKDLLIIQHNKRRGCTKAFNDGFRVAVGEYCCQLSDDVWLEQDCLTDAVRMLDDDNEIGQVIITHIGEFGNPSTPRVKLKYGEYPFAPFGITRRWLGDQVGWWGDYYHVMGDPELSLKIIKEGYRIETLQGKHVRHIPGPSDLRNHRQDLELFRLRWYSWRPQK